MPEGFQASLGVARLADITPNKKFVSHLRAPGEVRDRFGLTLLKMLNLRNKEKKRILNINKVFGIMPQKSASLISEY